MKNQWKWVVSVCTVVVMLCGSALQAADIQSMQADDSDESEIRILMSERDRQIKSVIGESDDVSDAQREELEQIVNEMVDYPTMARYALDDTWGELDSETRSEFTQLFSSIVRDQSMNNMEIYRAEISYGEIEVKGEKAHVMTEASLQSVTTQVNYTLMRRDGEWMITDIILDEVSTADSYHRQFQSVIRQRGFDALLQSLKRRAERID